MNEAGEKPLAGTGFSLEQDGRGTAPRGLASDEAADGIADGLDSGTLTDQLV
jgi:hypothetical protein